jgi:hypothetical protein
MPVELNPVQRRVATRFSRLVHDLSGERIATELGIAAQEVYGDLRFAQLLIQLHLKHVEMSKVVIASFRSSLFSPTAALTRPLLEGAVKLVWAAVPDATEERRKRLLRILVRAYRELEEEGVTLPPGERALLDEADRQHLRGAPDARGAMRTIDRAGVEAGGPPFLEEHYNQFTLSSQQLHVHLDGPALFREDPARGEMVIFVEPRILLGFSSLRYAAYYFSLATQATAMLLALDDLRESVVRRYNAIVDEADVELLRLAAAGQP